MQRTPSVTWDGLKSEYYYNLKTLQTAIDVVYNSAFELNRIYSDVMKKARDSPQDTMKAFADSWLKKIDIDNIEFFLPIKEDYKKLLVNTSHKDYQDFGAALQQKLHKNSIASLEAYHLSMQTFYDTWIEMWSK